MVRNCSRSCREGFPQGRIQGLGRVQKPGPKVHENYLSSIKKAKANQYPGSPWQMCTNLHALRGTKCILQTGWTSVCFCHACILKSVRSEKHRKACGYPERAVFCLMSDACRVLVLPHSRWLCIFDLFGYFHGLDMFGSLRCKPRGMRHFLILFALAWPLALIQRKRALQFLWPTWSRRDVAQEHSCTRLVMKHRCCKAYRMNQNDRIIICEDVAVQLHRFDTQMLHGLRRVWHSQNQCPLAESGWKTSPVLLEKYYKYMNHTYKYENEHIACWWTLPTILVFYTSELGNCKIARNFINCMQY